jgi:hypothetical protein
MTSRSKCACILFLLSLLSGAVSAQIYFTSSNLPLVVINTGGKAIVDDPKITADMGIIWNGAGKRNALTDPANNFNGKIGIEIRGSSSQMFPKKSYGFETKNSNLETTDYPLLDMPKENDWILYAPYTDKTMIRDVLTYTLDAKLGHWSPRCRFVELFLNGTYQGVYVLMEKIKRNKNRVNISKMKATDNSGENLTGGYIIKIDKITGSGGEGWYSNYSNTLGKTFYQYEYPKADEITTLQESYIQTYVKMMENVLYNENFKNPGNYHEYLNDSTFIDFMIMNELSKNVDGYRLSAFLFKDRNGLFNCGPIWDFNLGYGNADYYNGWIPAGFQYQAYLDVDSWQVPFWWRKLMKDQAYVAKLKTRWTTLRKKELADQRITFVIDSLTNLLSESKDRNYLRWQGVIGFYIWPNYYIGQSYNEEVTWMKNWIAQRLAFLDGQWIDEATGAGSLIVPQRFSVYPNPFSNRLTVQLPSGISGKLLVELYNSTGSLVRSNEVAVTGGDLQLNFTGTDKLVPGLYLYKLVQNNRLLASGKVVEAN